MKQFALQITFFCVFLPAFCQWNPVTTVNTPLVVQPGTQSFPEGVSDQSGGAYIVWDDSRSGNNDVYLQRVNQAGIPQWTANGVGISTVAGDQEYSSICEDSAGGCYVAWQDDRGGDFDIYAQHIGPAGTPSWTANGLPVFVGAGIQKSVVTCATSDGGLAMVWADGDQSMGTVDVWAQKLNAAGVPQWGGGVLVCGLAGNQLYARIAPDSAGGAYIGWSDPRSGSGNQIFLQRLNSAGVPQWVANGIAINAPAGYSGCALTKSDSGDVVVSYFEGIIPIWTDIYCQRVDMNGNFKWGPTQVSTSTQVNPASVFPKKEADGGVAMSWIESRAGQTDVIWQRIYGDGTAQCTIGGLQVTNTPAAESYSYMAGRLCDFKSARLVIWGDNRGATTDIYGEKIDTLCNLLCLANGNVISDAAGNQTFPGAFVESNYGIICAWNDTRNGNTDIYMTYVSCDSCLSGVLDIDLEVFEGKEVRDGILLNWKVTNSQDFSFFLLEKKGAAGTFVPIGRFNSRSKYSFSHLDQQPLPGINQYRLRTIGQDGKTHLSKSIRVDFQNHLPKILIYPNPAEKFVTLQSQNEEILFAELRDFQGRVLLEFDFKIEKKLVLDQYESGVYLLSIRDRSGLHLEYKKLVLK